LFSAGKGPTNKPAPGDLLTFYEPPG